MDLSEFDLSSFVPYCLDFKNEHVVLTPSSNHFEASPFLYQEQRAYTSQVLRVPFAAYKNYFLRRKENISRLNFIFSIGRCGSTLASALASKFGSPVFSEPDVFLNLNKKSLGSDGQLLKAFCKHFVMLSPNAESRITIKLRAENTWLMPVVAQHIPGSRILFLTRDLAAWQRSYASKFSRSNEGLLRLLRQCFDGYRATKDLSVNVAHFNFESFSVDPYAMLKEILGYDVDSGTYGSKLREVLSRDSQAGTEIGTFEKSLEGQAVQDLKALEFMDFLKAQMTPAEIAFFGLA